MGRKPEWTFSQRLTDGQQAHEKMLNITNYQRNANQNNNEISPQNNKCCKDMDKREHLCTFGGNINWCSHFRKQYGGSSEN